MWIWIQMEIMWLYDHHGRTYKKFRKKWEWMYWITATWRINKKLKSIRHYIVNNDNQTAYKFYRQLEKEIKILYPDYE